MKQEIQNGSGDRFLKKVLEKYHEISAHPQYYGFIDETKTVRDVRLRIFLIRLCMK